MNKLLLVRHGLSIGNASGIIQGKSNYCLSEIGKKDVKKLVEDNRKIFTKYENIVSSPLLRASQTATIIGETLNKSVTIDPLLEEFRAGILDGLKKETAEKLYPEYYSIWKKRGDLDAILGAEKADAVQARALMFIERYLNSDFKEIVVSHAGFMRCLINTMYGRDRTTAIELDHKNIYEIENVWKNIGLQEYTIAKNSRVFRIETFDKKYIMKKISKKSIEEPLKEKRLLDYLSRRIYTPQILGISEKENYILKVMNYANGENIHDNLNQAKIENTTKELYKLKELLRNYNDSDKYETVDLISTLNNLLNKIDDSEIKNIILAILNNEKFNNGIRNDNIQLVHDDLHRDNILYHQDTPIFLDFEGLKKWPSLYQLASHIAASYLIRDNSFNIDAVLKSWPEKIDVEYLNGLIIFRLLQGYNYFCERIKSGCCSSDDFELQKKYVRSLKIITN